MRKHCGRLNENHATATLTETLHGFQSVIYCWHFRFLLKSMIYF